MLGPKAGGLLGLFLGAGFMVIPWISAAWIGKISLLASVLGPVVLSMSLALLILPIRKLFFPIGEDEAGEPIYDFHKPKYTPLMWGVIVIGVALGGAYTLYLMNAV